MQTPIGSRGATAAPGLSLKAQSRTAECPLVTSHGRRRASARGPREPQRVQIGREPPDEIDHHGLDPGSVLLEDLQHAHRVHRLGPLDDAGVVVGDQADVDDGHPQLAAQPRLGVLGHADDLPAGVAEPLRFGLRRETRTLDDHDGPALVDLDPMVADGGDGELAKDRVVDLGRRQVGDDRAVEERVGTSVRAIDELVAYDEIAGLDADLQRSRGTRRDDRLHAQRAHGPDVGPVVDPVRRDRVAPAVTRQERDFPAAHVGEEDRIRRRAVRRIDLDLAYVVEERVEARAPEHSDLRGVRHDRLRLVSFAPPDARCRQSCQF